MILPSDDLSSPNPEALEDLVRITQIIQAQSPEARRRIAVTAQILRDLLSRDATDESLLAFTLVMTEFARD